MRVAQRTTLCALPYHLMRLCAKQTGAIAPLDPPEGGKENHPSPELFRKKSAGSFYQRNQRFRQAKTGLLETKQAILQNHRENPAEMKDTR